MAPWPPRDPPTAGWGLRSKLCGCGLLKLCSTCVVFCLETYLFKIKVLWSNRDSIWKNVITTAVFSFAAQQHHKKLLELLSISLSTTDRRPQTLTNVKKRFKGKKSALETRYFSLKYFLKTKLECSSRISDHACDRMFATLNLCKILWYGEKNDRSTNETCLWKCTPFTMTFYHDSIFLFWYL